MPNFFLFIILISKSNKIKALNCTSIIETPVQDTWKTKNRLADIALNFMENLLHLIRDTVVIMKLIPRVSTMHHAAIIPDLR